eukprot:TRINITY_DN36088_c0_g1_i3.p1 TRINITY_DN36088_c0_g1~~TRINITY_DN36088_c0_g1_i3.p1  ORF type:complete len:823 (+),score=178.39 TRINITY_DN36088_c0_g1_i3:65-2533(+)
MDCYISEEAVKERLGLIQRYVAQPLPGSATDPEPAFLGEGLFLGSRHHAADVDKLVSLGVTALLNCAPLGISSLPFDAYESKGIRYKATNCRRDDETYCDFACTQVQRLYPLLHDPVGTRSEHLRTAKSYYEEVIEEGGSVFFFCVAGQNRSATLAVACLMLHGQPLERILKRCSRVRPFIMENAGFQKQVVQLEALMNTETTIAPARKRRKRVERPAKEKQVTEDEFSRARSRSLSSCAWEDETGVVVELHVPGLFKVFETVIPVFASIPTVKAKMIAKVNEHLENEMSAHVARSFLVYHGGDAADRPSAQLADLVLESEAVEGSLQLESLQKLFGLELSTCQPGESDTAVRWKCKHKFELVILSVMTLDQQPVHKPFTFRHHERPGAPGTLLANNMVDTHMRAWDFVSGESFKSKQPIVFSFSKNARNKRDFMDVSTTADNECLHAWHHERQSLNKPGVAGAGAILGMGANAIVHHVELAKCLSKRAKDSQSQKGASSAVSRSATADEFTTSDNWDAAAKRPFTLEKMLSSMESTCEAGMAKRMRMAGALNKPGRLLYFYGLGIAVASNCDDRDEFKFEVVLLSSYHTGFSTYTLKRFLDDYLTTAPHDESMEQRWGEISRLQKEFSLIKVKVLLVSLLNGFRDLTLMGIQAFDFNHLDNVLISRDYRKARIIDIDGQAKGSIQYPSEYIEGKHVRDENHQEEEQHLPALDIDLNVLLPTIVAQLILGKGRGKSHVSNKLSSVRRAQTEEEAKEIIKASIRENFFEPGPSLTCEASRNTEKHLGKVVEWFYALSLKKRPWTNWTHDIYDAMRCIDHLPVS